MIARLVRAAEHVTVLAPQGMQIDSLAVATATWRVLQDWGRILASLEHINDRMYR